MGNISQNDIELIESHLNKNGSPIEKKIHDEYMFLKNYSAIQIIENEKKAEKNLPNTKGIINPIKVKKRLERFVKWFKMIFSSDNEIYINKKLIKYKTISFPDNCETIKFSPTEYIKNIYDESLSNNNILNQNKNIYELSLRRYYELNKLHFLQRVKKGPPESLRWISWMIILNIPENRNELIYNKYLLMEVDEKSDNQIKKDLNRTINENNIIELKKTESEKKEKEKILYRILKVMANIDKECGYCQGINFIAGYLLEINDYNELETFYLLISLFSKNFDSNFNIRGFFIDNFPLLKCYLYIFDNLLEKEIPDLKKYISKNEIPHEAWIGKWIQTLYTICLPSYLNFRVWDYILSTGLFFIISFSISLIYSIYKDLICLKDAFDFSEYLKNFFNLSYGDGTQNGSILYKLKDSNKCIILDNILENAEKLHKNCLSKNLYLNLQDEFILKKKSISSYAIYYNIESSNNISNITNCHNTKNGFSTKSNSNIIYNLKLNITKDNEENVDSDCDEDIKNESNFINFDDEYVFETKKKNDTKK